MSDLYICIDCELVDSQAQPTALNEHGYCPRCGSSSVVPVDTLVELDAKRSKVDSTESWIIHAIDELSTNQLSEVKRLLHKHSKPPSTDTTHAHRVQAMKDQRKRDSRPLVDYLKSLIKPDTTSTISVENAAILARALENWDGWSWHVHYPWKYGHVDNEDNPAPGHFTIELVQGVKNGERWLILLDAELVEVRLFQDGMN